MPVFENLLGKVIEEIIRKSAEKAWKSATRSEKVLKVLNNVGFKPGNPIRISNPFMPTPWLNMALKSRNPF